MTEVVTIAIVDDQALTREGVIRIIDRTPGFEVVAEGATSGEAIEIFAQMSPSITILDLDIPGGGREALRWIKENRKDSKVMILSTSSDEDNVFELLTMGADGYVLKSISADELIYALGMLNRGGRYVMPSLAAQMLTVVGRSRRGGVVPVFEGLTQREREIAIKVGEGLSNKIIGRALGLSEKTIKHYLTIIFKKLCVPNRQALISWLHEKTVSAGPDAVVPIDSLPIDRTRPGAHGRKGPAAAGAMAGRNTAGDLS